MTEKTLSAPNSKRLTTLAIVFAVIAVIGIVCWVMQLSGGLVQTGMRNLDSWGLYITCFMFFVGLSAGGLIISSVPNAFGIEGFGGISKVAIWTSICCTIAAIAFVVVDLGQPARLWELFISSNLSSPLMWDIIVLFVYLILSCFYLWATIRVEKGQMSRNAHRALSIAALIVAVLVHSVTAWIFSLNAGREMWNTALMGPWFVCSALVCGTALVLVVVLCLRKAGYLDVEDASISKMAKLLGIFACVEIYFFACDLLTEGFPAGDGAAVVSMLTGGPLAPLFWAELVCLILAIAICFAPAARKDTPLIVAGLLAIVAIFLKRAQLLVGGFQLPNIDLAGPVNSMTVTNWATGMPGAFSGMVYAPQPIEFGVALGVIGLCFALLFFGLAKLPLAPAEAE